MTTTSSDSDFTWMVEVVEPLPNCPSAKAAYDVLGAVTKQKEWRSSKFATMKFVLPDGVTEPVKKGDEYFAHMGPMKMTLSVLDSKCTQDEMVLETEGKTLCGLIHSRIKFSVYKDDKGAWMGKAQEAPLKGRWAFPNNETIEGEHLTMYRELDKKFTEEKS